MLYQPDFSSSVHHYYYYHHSNDWKEEIIEVSCKRTQEQKSLYGECTLAAIIEGENISTDKHTEKPQHEQL